MKKFLCFKFKEPFEKMIDKILEAKEKKQKIEFSGSDICKMGDKQVNKYLQWISDNRDWLEDKVYAETELERLKRELPASCSVTIYDLKNEKYFIFDFR